jgi:outer membrane protein, heavy metal efflux system
MTKSLFAWLAGGLSIATIAVAVAQSVPPPAAPTAPGASVDELLAIARRMSPELAAMGLEAEAAVARADAAGALPDPVFRGEFEDIERRAGSLAPDRLGMIKYGIQQEFPLWGKRDLRENVARSEASAARERRRGAETELTARIKTVFAGYYAAHEALQLTEDLARSVGTLADVAQRRYAQGFGNQQEAIKAGIEKIEIQTEIARAEAEKRKTAAQINALLNRAPGEPLARPQSLRPIPPGSILNLPELLERARRGNPQLAADEAQIAAAADSRKLVDKNWYPDVTLGLSAVDRDRQFAGYEAMIEFKVPLQWGLRRAQEREAAATLGAARSRLDAAAARVRGEIAEAYWALDAASKIYRLLHGSHLPQTRLAYETALSGYELGRVDLNTVLEAEQRVRRVLLEHLKVLVEQHARLADLERLIGGEL